MSTSTIDRINAAFSEEIADPRAEERRLAQGRREQDARKEVARKAAERQRKEREEREEAANAARYKAERDTATDENQRLKRELMAMMVERQREAKAAR